MSMVRRESKLHLLFNNAGVMASPPDMKTKQGYEQQLGVNVVGPFLFTKLLLPVMVLTAESMKSDSTAPKDFNTVRVINTSSNGHAGAPPGGFKFDNPNELNSKWAAYGQSKWSNIIVANEIAKKYGDKGITAHSLNPGVIKTELTRYSSLMERSIIVSGSSLLKCGYARYQVNTLLTECGSFDLIETHCISSTHGCSHSTLRRFNARSRETRT